MHINNENFGAGCLAVPARCLMRLERFLQPLDYPALHRVTRGGAAQDRGAGVSLGEIGIVNAATTPASPTA